MIKGIVFDFDGLTFDTETPEYRCWQEIFTEHNAEFSLARWLKEIVMLSDSSFYIYLEKQIGRKINRELVRDKFTKKLKKMLSSGEPRPGVINYLRYAKKLNLKIGLASRSTYSWVAGHLQKLNLIDYFECIKTSDDMEKVKPDPSLYLEATKCLGLDPEECIAFEDSRSE